MTRRRALGAFPDRGAPASSDGASAVTLVGSKVIGLSTLGVALLATAYVWASTVLMLLNGAAVLALIFWIGVTVWRQVGRDPRLHTAFGDKVRALAIGALHRPLLVVGPDSGSRRRRRRCAYLSHPCCPDRRGRHHRASTADGSYPRHGAWATLPSPRAVASLVQAAKSRTRSRGPSRGRSGCLSRSIPNATRINRQRNPWNSAFLSPYRDTPIGMKQLCWRLGR